MADTRWTKADAVVAVVAVLIVIGIGVLTYRIDIAGDGGAQSAASSDTTGRPKDYARGKMEECLRRGNTPPAGMTAQTFCEAYGNVQAICKYDRKSGAFCE